jgi:branched-chain amino acid transport system ATP-binding protein
MTIAVADSSAPPLEVPAFAAPEPGPSPGVALLRLENISLTFRGVRALDDVSFEVAAGEICALIGPNGAGKSSLLNVISGVYVPERGRITFGAQTLSRARPAEAAQRGIARTFQNIALFRGMTVLENVIVGGHLKRHAGIFAQALRTPRARREELAARVHADKVIDLLGIARHRDTVVGELPYGVQKRVELARALAAEPKLVLLDEPMAGMTAEEKQEMSAFIADANGQLGATVVLIEHDIGVVMDLADHLVVLDYGRKIADGRPEDVRRDQTVIDAYLGVAH